MLTNAQIQERLVGMDVGAISFVRDYVELVFDYDAPVVATQVQPRGF
jgi:hypothetical protein